MTNIWSNNHNLQRRFDESYPDDAEYLRRDAEDENGVIACNGVLCYYSDCTSEYAIDTPRNREIAVTQYDDDMAMAKQEEYAL